MFGCMLLGMSPSYSNIWCIALLTIYLINFITVCTIYTRLPSPNHEI